MKDFKVCFSKKHLKKFSLVIIPLIIMIVFFLISSHLFAQNKKETYQLLKQQKELAVDRVVYAADEAVGFMDVDHLTDEQKFIVKTAIGNINEQPEVHCYLLDNKFQLVSDYNDRSMTEEDTKLLYALSHYDNLNEIIKKEDNTKHDDNYFEIKTEDGNYEFYWRKIPTNNTEFYVLVGISESKVVVNKVVDTCKVFIACLNLLLTISLYGNIVMINNRDNCNNK